MISTFAFASCTLPVAEISFSDLVANRFFIGIHYSKETGWLELIGSTKDYNKVLSKVPLGQNPQLIDDRHFSVDGYKWVAIYDLNALLTRKFEDIRHYQTLSGYLLLEHNNQKIELYSTATGDLVEVCDLSKITANSIDLNDTWTNSSKNIVVIPDAGRFAYIDRNGDLVIRNMSDQQRITPKQQLSDYRLFSQSGFGSSIYLKDKGANVTKFDLNTETTTLAFEAPGDIQGLVELGGGISMVSAFTGRQEFKGLKYFEQFWIVNGKTLKIKDLPFKIYGRELVFAENGKI